MNFLFIDTSTPWIFTCVIKKTKDHYESIYTSIDKIDPNDDRWMHSHIKFLSDKHLISLQKKSLKIILGRGPGSFTSLRVAFLYIQIIADQYQIPLKTFYSLNFFQAGFHIPKDIPLFIRTNRNLYYVFIPSIYNFLINHTEIIPILEEKDFYFANLSSRVVEGVNEINNNLKDLIHSGYFWEEPYFIHSPNQALGKNKKLIKINNFSWEKTNLFLENNIKNNSFSSQFSPFYGHTLNFIQKHQPDETINPQIS